MSEDYNSEFTIPIKVKWTPFKRCEECGKIKLSTVHYEFHDAGLMSHIDYHVCRKCMRKAEKRASCRNEI